MTLEELELDERKSKSICVIGWRYAWKSQLFTTTGNVITIISMLTLNRDRVVVFEIEIDQGSLHVIEGY